MSDFEPDFQYDPNRAEDPPSIATMQPLLRYLTVRLLAKDGHTVTLKRRLIKPLWLIEDYFDMHILHNFHLEYGEMDPKIRHLFECKIKAYTAYPFEFKDFINENMRVLYWIWLFYFRK